MPGFGPDNVIWHSNPGDCVFSFERIYQFGGESDNPEFTITVPPMPDASDGTALVLLASATNDWLIWSLSLPFFIDAHGVRRSPDIFFSRPDDGFITRWPKNGSPSIGLGGMSFTGWSRVGAGGGTLGFTASSYHLNLIFGVLFRSANGVAVAAAIDLERDAFVAPAGVHGTGTPADAVNFTNRFFTSTDVADVTATDPLGTGLVLAGVATLGGALPDSVGPGWTTVVRDSQPLTQTGGDGGRWPPSGVGIAVYNNDTSPPNLTESWSLAGSTTQWMTTAGLVRYAVNQRGISVPVLASLSKGMFSWGRVVGPV